MDALTIDAVALVRSIRDRNYQRLLDKSPEERLAFYHEQARLMNAKAQVLLQAKEAQDEGSKQSALD